MFFMFCFFSLNKNIILATHLRALPTNRTPNSQIIHTLQLSL